MTARAPSVELHLPSVLRVMVGTDRVRASGQTVGEALEHAFSQHPQLRYQVALESGELRPHVLCLLNGNALPRDQVQRTALSRGDRLEIHQAISGG